MEAFIVSIIVVFFLCVFILYLKKNRQFKNIKSENNLHKEKEIIDKNKIDYLENKMKNGLNRTAGEVQADREIDNIKDILVKEGYIEQWELQRLSNFYFKPAKGNRAKYFPQVDHLLLTSRGLYLIESKYWKGKIFYGINQHTHAKIYSELVPHEQQIKQYEDSYTYVFKHDQPQPNIYGKGQNGQHPGKQVKKTALLLSKRIKEALGFDLFIRGIVYFNHSQKIVIKANQVSDHDILDSQNKLEIYVKNIFNTSMCLSQDEIENIKNLIQKDNIQ